ncbi:MAG: divalent metal cation transporter [Candidatus Thermoplasmatota archaeon]|nr:divalent metal cation transporter [Candidatus Thermoplasmatota archaeon]MCL5793957.1 divalent metal cation transporter [Candidatus Thermoplasmatota archaeon]
METQVLRRIIAHLFNLGPAWTVMIADVDVASIVTGLESGSAFGYHGIFILAVLVLPLAVIQYAAGKLGLVTGKGLGELIREHYGNIYSAASTIPMAATDFLSYLAEYAGIAIGLGLIGIPPLISLPVFYILHNLVVLTRNFGRIEKILLPVSMLSVAVVITLAMLFHPPAADIILGFSPVQPYGNGHFDYYMAAMIGAVIMPFMLFYQIGATAGKKTSKWDIRHIRNETAAGAVVSELLMICILLVGASGINGLGQTQIAGIIFPEKVYANILLAVCMVSAGFLALVVISLASAWGVAETFGWIAQGDFRKGETGKFYLLYVAESLPAMMIAITLGSNLLGLVIALMASLVIVLVPSGIFVGRLAGSSDVMGGYALSRRYMTSYWLLLLSIEAAGLWGIALELFG